jgi:hypothetical protein
MDNDIVTQLRAFISVANSGGDDLHAEHLREAADEIEHLRALVKMAEICSNRWRDRALKVEALL